MVRFLWVIVVLCGFSACDREKNESNELRTGIWRGVIEIQNRDLPFNLEIVKDSAGGYDAYIINAGERLLLDEVTVANDSVDMPLHVFDANIRAAIDGDRLTGVFIKNYEKDYRLPFRAVYGETFRFAKVTKSARVPDFSGKYEVTFTNPKDTTRAIGVFHQAEDSVTGTFLTATGDYRYLQGNVVNDTMKLSTFDGNHAYLFTAVKTTDGTLSGRFFSGKSFNEDWTGVKNENATLEDPESLTYLKEGYDRIEFSFPDADGKPTSLTDAKYRNKVIVLQVLGTWCPNCMDETRFLSEWYPRNKDRGVEIIGLAFERKADFQYASARVKKMAEKFGVDYDVLIAGTDQKEKAAQSLPMLNRIVAFPTTIFIGKDGKVKKIHTGFSGPGTGVYYEQFIQEFNETINELLNDKTASIK